MFEESTRKSNARALHRRQSTWAKIKPFIGGALALGAIVISMVASFYIIVGCING